MELIYCAARVDRFRQIALAAGFRYGAQLPGFVYDRAIYFADQNWKAPDRAAYCAALADIRPPLATVLDWERADQLPEVLGWAEEIAPWVETIILIPKVPGGIGSLPRTIGGRAVRLGYSVPTAYGGTDLWLGEFAGWPVHLLGGSPHAQMRLTRYLDVQSADGNMAQKMALRGRVWCAYSGPKGQWHALRDVGGGEITEDIPYEAFHRSCVNIRAAWDHLLAEREIA